MIRSRLPIIRIFLVPYLVVLLLFVTMTGAGSAWIYYKARQAQSELLIHGLITNVRPVLDHIGSSPLSPEIQDRHSWLHRELDAIFTAVPELEDVQMQAVDSGFHKYHDSARKLITDPTSAVAAAPARDLRSQTAPSRLFSEDEPLLLIQFHLTSNSGEPVDLAFGFDRATLHGSVNRAMAIIKQAILLFFLLGLVCIGIALATTLWAAKKALGLEASMHELYQRAETSELMSGLVHDLRNPLASFRANLASLRITPEDAGEILTEMDDDLVRLDEKLAAILNLTRKRDEQVAPVEGEQLCSVVERLSRPVLEEKEIELNWINWQGKPIQVMEQALGDVLLNLVLNSAQSGQQGGMIEVELIRQPGQILIEVRDRGNGLPPDTDIFAPFVTTRAKGHGLGLAISRRTVEAHGGTISAANRAGGGAVFTIIIPQPPEVEGM
jgi:signal transduction histidine kinase